jgi:hypothetical protein
VRIDHVICATADLDAASALFEAEFDLTAFEPSRRASAPAGR